MAARPRSAQIEARSFRKLWLNTVRLPTGLPFGLPKTPGGHIHRARCLKLFVQVPDIRVELPFSTDLFPNDHILANHLLWVVALSLKHCIALFASSVGAE